MGVVTQSNTGSAATEGDYQSDRPTSRNALSWPCDVSGRRDNPRVTNDAAFAPEALPSPAEVLAQTPWSDLSHAMGPAADVPLNLTGLLDTDQHRRTSALNFLHQVVHHQNTLYEATVPAIMYVVGILPDPRTARPIDLSHKDLPGPMRAALLGWLGSVASEANDAAAEISRRHGFPPEDYLPFVQTNRLLPLLFSPVAAYARDPDLAVREAAVAACIPLVDDARLRQHRTALIPLVRGTLGVSAEWQYRERAIAALEGWGEDTTGLVGRGILGRSSTPTYPAVPMVRTAPPTSWQISCRSDVSHRSYSAGEAVSSVVSGCVSAPGSTCLGDEVSGGFVVVAEGPGDDGSGGLEDELADR
jgi:hypothetical protein